MTYQLTAPLLDACVLGVVESEDVYGYTLTQRVMDVVDISESTLYPVLRRLQKSGLLTTYDQPYQGRNRRYYSITAEGSAQLDFFRNEWDSYKTRIDRLINPDLYRSDPEIGSTALPGLPGPGSRNTDPIGENIQLMNPALKGTRDTDQAEMILQIAGQASDDVTNDNISEENAGNTEGGTQ